jgi:hypothetical protein
MVHFGAPMAREPSPTQKAEFQRLLAFVTIGFEQYAGSLPVAPDQTPAALATAAWAESPSVALQGLREAARDVVEMSQDLDGVALVAFEQRLANAGAPALYTMRIRRVRSLYQILARGRIQSDEEYRLVSAVVSDTADRLLDNSSRRLAETLMAAYATTGRWRSKRR